MHRLSRAMVLAASVACAARADVAGAQSLLDRSPNMSGAWVGSPGTLHFNFLHRFTQGDAPARKVVSSPTFLLAAGLPSRTLAGLNYATNSDVAARYPNEWEFFGRFAALAQEGGGPVDAGVQLGYNLAARSIDGELALGRRFGPVRLQGAARILSNAFDLDTARYAVAGGATLRLGRYVALAGDYAALLDAPAAYDNAWSAALQIAIPYTPHTLSLHASNTSTGTLHGASASRGGQRRYGFEFTIPITLRRYFPRSSPPNAEPDTRGAPETGAAAGAPPDTARAARDSLRALEPPRDTVMTPPDTTRPPRDTTLAPRDTTGPRRDTLGTPPREPARPAPRRVVVQAGIRQLAYTPMRIEIAAGTTIEWTNNDPLAHTVTADDRRWDSGIIEPGRRWSRQFDRPGTYPFHCTPHPFMKGVVVVR